MTIELRPEIEAGLLAEARAKDTSVEAIIEKLFEPYARKEPHNESPEEWIRALREWALSHPPIPHLPDEAISRESLYEDRG